MLKGIVKQKQQSSKVQGFGMRQVNYRKPLSIRLLNRFFDIFEFVDFRKFLSLLALFFCVFFVLPMCLIGYRAVKEKKNIESLANIAYGNIKSAKESVLRFDLGSASGNLNEAALNFSALEKKLDRVSFGFSSLLRVVPVASKIDSALNLSIVGEELSGAGKEGIDLMNVLLSNKENIRSNIKKRQNTNEKAAITLLDVSNESFRRLKVMEAKVKKANKHLALVKLSDIPEGQRSSVAMLKEYLPQAEKYLSSLIESQDTFFDLIGGNGVRRYMLLFENNHEMRATGGFIGTYGIVKINNGQVEDFFIDGIYNPDGQLKEDIVPPKPLQKVTNHWSMRDANWWPNFPDSAKQIASFYEKTGGPTVDGMIVATPSLVKNILKVTGPIKIKGYGPDGIMTIGADNFMDTVQQQVEIDYDKKENKPKKILSDLAPLLFKKVYENPSAWGGILVAARDALEEKQVLFYFSNEKAQSVVSSFNLGGEMTSYNLDYISVINSNIGSKKTDGVIEQRIVHDAFVQEDGTILVVVKIRKSHKGGNTGKIWFDGPNNDFVRVYVPLRSEFVYSQGFMREYSSSEIDFSRGNYKKVNKVLEEEKSQVVDENTGTIIYNEGKYTVFANWMNVFPGETKEAKIMYFLPYRFNLNSLLKREMTYSLLAQKQIGDEGGEIEVNLYGLRNFDFTVKQPENLKLNDEGFTFVDKFNKDKEFKFAFRRR